MTVSGELLLAGGGHSHALLLKRWAMRPARRPQQSITLINRSSTALYSGMVPGLIAGIYQRDEIAIDLRQLCDRAGVAFVEAEITGLNPEQTVCTYATALHPLPLAQPGCRSCQQTECYRDTHPSPWKPRWPFSNAKTQAIPSHFG